MCKCENKTIDSIYVQNLGLWCSGYIYTVLNEMPHKWVKLLTDCSRKSPTTCLFLDLCTHVWAPKDQKLKHLYKVLTVFIITPWQPLEGLATYSRSHS